MAVCTSFAADSSVVTNIGWFTTILISEWTLIFPDIWSFEVRSELYFSSSKIPLTLLILSWGGPLSVKSPAYSVKSSPSPDDTSDSSHSANCFSSSFYFLSLSSNSFYSFACSFFALYLSNSTMITARMRLSRKKAPMRTRRQKYIIDIAIILESIRLYIMNTHPSRVIAWKIEMRAYPRWSNPVIP